MLTFNQIQLLTPRINEVIIVAYGLNDANNGNSQIEAPILLVSGFYAMSFYRDYWKLLLKALKVIIKALI